MTSPDVCGAYGGRQSVDGYEKDGWITPQTLYLGWHRKYNFTIDVAADHHNAKCERYYTIADNGLLQSWSGERVYCNPPYSKVEYWLKKAHSERDEAFSFVVVKADTSTDWFHWLWRTYKNQECDIDFLKRIQFVPPPGYVSKSGNTKPGSPNMGHLICQFGLKNL